MLKRKQNKIQVLMVGSSCKVKGGMTTVVKSFLEHDFSDEIYIHYIPTHIESKKTIYKILFFLFSLICICFNLIFYNVKIVHMHMSERGSFSRKYIVFKMAKCFGCKIVTHTHGAEFEDFFSNSNDAIQYKIRKLLKESDVVITLGENWDKKIKTIEPDCKTFILRNAVEIPVETNNLNKETINVLFLAVLIQRKGIIDLIEASNEIIKELKKNNLKIKFTIAGEGELLHASKELVKEKGLSEFFDFIGWVDGAQKEKILREASLFILPSYNEGLPLSILEAMSYGIPIISTNVGSINEAVRNGTNGYLIEPGDIEMLTESTINLVLASNYIEIGSNSRQIAVEYFDIDCYFNKVADVYLTL